MDFVTKTAGVKAERQQMKSVRCKKDVGARRDGERIGQRWMKRARGMCISICLHFIRPSVSISLCLSLSGLAHCPWLLRRSLTLMEFEEKEAREEQGKKKKKESKKEQDSLGLYCRDPLPSVRCLLSASLTARPLRETTHTHTQLKDIYVFGTYTPERVHAARTAACCFFSKVGCDNLDHLLHSDEPPSLKIKGGREEERKRGGWIGRRGQRMLLCCQQKHCFMDAVFTVVLPYCVCVCVCVCVSPCVSVCLLL